MTLQTITRGQNASITAAGPNKNGSGLSFQRLQSGQWAIMLSIPVTGIRGQTVVHAELSPRVRGPWAAQTLSVAALSAAWSVEKVTWANRPLSRFGLASKATGALVDGARTSIDVTTLVQQIADGLPHYGWIVTSSSSADSRVYGFAYDESWVLTIETSDAPNKPVTLEPNNGVVSLAKWVVRTDFVDLGGATELAAIQVQVDPNGTGNNPWTTTTGTTWDSGQVLTNVPKLDLATTSYPGLSAGATTKWRVRVRDSDGIWSDPSDWATVTRVAKPSLIIDAPSGGVLWDVTPTLEAHLSSGSLVGWSIAVTDGDDRTKIRYDSGRGNWASGSSFALGLPTRNEDGDVILRDDTTYQLRFRAWDRTDRVQGGPDDPPYIEAWTTVTVDSDGAVTAPEALQVENVAGSPRVTLTWTRAGTADGWVVARDGRVIARLEPYDVDVNAGVYTWVDEGAPPHQEHTWSVRAVTNGRQGDALTATGYSDVRGVWLLSAHGDVVLDGTGIDDLRRSDRRATYRLPGRPDDVDIVGAFEGIAGTYEGSIERTYYRTPAEVDAARTVLRRIRRDPGTPVRLVYATTSVPVLLRHLSVTASPDFQPNNRQHLVRFECWQVGEFD
jgi:hypothetical protein